MNHNAWRSEKEEKRQETTQQATTWKALCPEKKNQGDENETKKVGEPKIALLSP